MGLGRLACDSARQRNGRLHLADHPWSQRIASGPDESGIFVRVRKAPTASTMGIACSCSTPPVAWPARCGGDGLVVAIRPAENRLFWLVTGVDSAGADRAAWAPPAAGSKAHSPPPSRQTASTGFLSHCLSRSVEFRPEIGGADPRRRRASHGCSRGVIHRVLEQELTAWSFRRCRCDEAVVRQDPGHVSRRTLSCDSHPNAKSVRRLPAA